MIVRWAADLLDRPPLRVLDAEPDVRPDQVAAVGDRRVRDRHLQRVGLQIALADREVDVVAHGPRPVETAVLVEVVRNHVLAARRIGLLGLAVERVAPRRRRQQALALAADVEARGLADPERPRPLLERAAVARVVAVVHAIAERVEVDVR